MAAKAGAAQYSPETTRSRSQGGGAVRDPWGVGGWRLLRTHLMCERGRGQSQSQMSDEKKKTLSDKWRRRG